MRRVTPDGEVTTVAGSGAGGSADGLGTAATFREPWGVAIYPSGALSIADTKNHRIRTIT